MSSPVVSSRTPVGQIINRDGTATFAFLKWMQNIGTTVNVAFDSEGAYQGDIGDQATIDGRATLASIVQNISTDGVVQGPGIDFALPYLNKDTDHIADGTGSPLAGGKEAYAVLVASGPASGQTIRFNGTDWLPVAVAVTKGSAVSQWLRSYDAATGTFTASQPNFSDLSGTLDPSQLPADIAYTDHVNVFTANQTISANLTVTGTVNGVPAATFPFLDPTSSVQTQLNSKQHNLTLTTTGTSGASTLVGATLNIPIYTAPAQVYPAAGIGVSTGAAWGTSIAPASLATWPAAGIPVSTGTAWGTPIPPANVALLNVANTFTANLTCTGIVSAAGIASTGFASPAANSFNLSMLSSTGYLDTFGPNPSTYPTAVNFRLASSNGTIVVTPIAMTSTGVAVTGTLSATGAKTFRVPHPLDETKDLVHACLEGPENGVFYRGESATKNGVVEITLPDYFEALTFSEDRTVHLTELYEDEANPRFGNFLAAGRVKDGRFTVRSSTKNVKFYWEVKAVRRIGVDKLEVVQEKA